MHFDGYEFFFSTFLKSYQTILVIEPNVYHKIIIFHVLTHIYWHSKVFQINLIKYTKT